jgi:hypothetical protein
LKVAFYPSPYDKVATVEDVSWQELAARLSVHRVSACSETPCGGKNCRSKNGPSWSPVDLIEPYCTDDNVRAVTAAVFDLDHQQVEDLACLERVEQSGHAFVLYSTHSHRPPDNYSLRLVFPVSRPVPAREWGRVRAAVEKLFGFKADEKTKNPSRIYYTPTVQPGVPPIYEAANGPPLDVDELLASAAQGSAPRASVALAAPSAGLTDAAVDMHELASVLVRRAKPENKELIRAHLRGDPLPVGEQDDRVNRIMGTCAFVLPESTPDEAIIELFRPCFSATDWREPGGTEHLISEALKKLHRGRERRKERDAEDLKKNVDRWESLGLELAKLKAPEPRDEGVEDPDVWVGELISKENRQVKELTPEERASRVQLKNCEANVELVLRCATEWRGVIRYNEVKRDIEISGGPISGVSPKNLDSAVAVWIQRSPWGRLGLMPKPALVREVVRQVAEANAYDPLGEYLNGLVWDGVGRVETLLENYFGAKGAPEYVRAVSKRWLVSGVARALRPGCKVDTMLILEGRQGLKKSTALRALAGEWFSDAKFDINNKDSAALAGSKWIIEFAEVETFKRAQDMEQLKAFLSRNEDEFRPPYGRVNEKFPRRCTFGGTTNSEEYLRNDASGYRRFWPVQCEVIDLDGLKRDRDQIWAEAVVLFKRGEQWHLTDAEAALAEEQATQRSESSGGAHEMILEWLLSLAPEKRSSLTMDQVAMEAFRFERPGQVTGVVRRDIGAAMRRLGFKRGQRRIAGVQTWLYFAPDEIAKAPVKPRR